MTWEPWNELLLCFWEIVDFLLKPIYWKSSRDKLERRNKKEGLLSSLCSCIKSEAWWFLLYYSGAYLQLGKPLAPHLAFCFLHHFGRELSRKQSGQGYKVICGGLCRIPSECVLGCAWGVREEAGKEQSEDWSFFNCFWQTHTCIRVSQH